MLHVGIIDNVSSQPYLLISPPEQVRLSRGTPAMVSRQMCAGRLDAALVSVVSLPAMAAFVETFGALGISCSGPVHSVLFFSDSAPRTLVEERKPIYITPQSLTSNYLLKLLFRMEYNRLPITASSPEGVFGRLLIGDEALIAFSQNSSGPIVTDLGEWWRTCTGLPFVFARWVCRKNLGAANRKILQEWIGGNLALSSTPEGQQILSARFPMGPSKKFAQQYYRDLQMQISAAAEEGQAFFEASIREGEQCPLNA